MIDHREQTTGSCPAHENGALSRRSFLKGSAIALAGTAAGVALAGCTSSGQTDAGAEEPKDVDTNAEEPAGPQADASASVDTAAPAVPDHLTDGTYLTKAVSMHGPINVKTVIADGAIAQVAVLNHRETYVIGESAVATMPTRIVESQCIDAGAVTGATVTSLAIRSAVEQAITNAGGDPRDFSGYTAPTPTKTSTDKKVDVAIVGAGMAGLMAAWELAEAGKTVVVFEKMPYIGGCLPMTSTAWNAQETAIQKAWGLDAIPNQSVKTTDAWLSVYTDFVLEKDSPYYNPEMPFITPMFAGVRQATDKLSEAGVGFCPIGSTSTPTLAPGQFSVGGKYMLQIMENRLVNQLGVEIITETAVTALTQDGDTVTGLVAEGADGTTYNVTAEATILACGGFVKNDELMQEYNPDDLKFFIMGPPWATGDGLLMAKDAGAAWTTMDQGVTSHYTAAKSLAEISFIHYVCPGVIVNGNGERFVSEAIEYKQALRQFKDQSSTDFYWIFDEVSRQGMPPSGNSYQLDYTFLLETGDIVQADNYQELAKETGLSGLVATLDTVNECAAGNAADEFGNEKLPAILTDGPMYALKVTPSPYIAQGGVMIDPACHVQREDGSIIPGLYAAGDVTGSVENRDGAMYRVGLTQALGYGVIAGQTVASELA